MDVKARIKYFYEVVVSENITEKYAEYIHEDCVARSGAEITPMGLSGMIEHSIAVRNTYPDMKMTVINSFSDNEYVICEFIMEGTHVGEWLGMKPTNRKLKFTGINIDKVIDGKIAEHSGAMNTFETLFGNSIIKPPWPEHRPRRRSTQP